MRSPFPGMDPFIEACGLWGDFHNGLISEMHHALAAAVPERYVVRAGERSYVELVEEEGKTKRPIIPDVRVSTGRPSRAPSRKSNVAIAETAAESDYVDLRAFIAEENREAFVQIIATEPEQHLVTMVEVLSPTNKREGSKGWELYQRKRQRLLLGGVNFVEIDLLQDGTKSPMLDAWPASPYTLLVARRHRAPLCRVWRAHWREPLPRIPVPLEHPDPDVGLNLQPMIEAIYRRSRYDQSIDYTKPPTPPLSPTDKAWLKRQLAARSAS